MKACLPLCLLGVLALICRESETTQSPAPKANPATTLHPTVSPGPGLTSVTPVTPLTSRPAHGPSPAPRQHLNTSQPVGATTTSTETTPADPETNSSSSSSSPSSSSSVPDTSPASAFQPTTDEDGRTVMSTTGNVTTVAVDKGSNTAVGGYVILFFLLMAIVAMVIILYLLRKRSRKYSFDLHRPDYDHDTPLTLQEQPGTFECVTERQKEKAPPIDEAKDDAPPVLANGTLLTGEGGVARDNSDSSPGGDSFRLTVTPPLKKVDFSLDIDLSDRASNQSGSTFSFLGGADAEQQNENNNNDSKMTEVPANSDLQVEVFTEISLDEPV